MPKSKRGPASHGQLNDLLPSPIECIAAMKVQQMVPGAMVKALLIIGGKKYWMEARLTGTLAIGG